MQEIKLIGSRHSAFYTPFIGTIAGGFLEKEGLTGVYRSVRGGESSIGEVASGSFDVGQSAVSSSWDFLEQGKTPPVAHFAQINTRDGFIVAARERELSFSWDNLLTKKFLYVHGAQPEIMLRYGLFRRGIDLDKIEGIFSSGGDEMMEQWEKGVGDYFHEQGAFPQQLEYEEKGSIVGSVGDIVGPVAFSSLICRWNWAESDVAKRFTSAYRAAREWANTAEPLEIAKAEAKFFPDIDVSAITSAIDYYQKSGTWSGGIEIDLDLYDRALDVFEHSNVITKRHPYQNVVIRPPDF